MKENQFSHEYFMRRCLQLAENGRASSMPNPCVGAVLVHEGRIIGEGCTSAYGGPHGEVNALNAVKEEDLSLISSSTLYVMLEPCSHYGKTPPCADLIVRHQIPHVVVGTLDPNPIVAGNGIQKLHEAGIRTEIGVLEEECQWSLRKFLISIQKKRPFITLKWAETQDRFIAHADGRPLKITSDATRIYTHRLRSESQAILVGWRTVQNDRPLLDVRYWEGRSPQPIVLDLNQRLNDNEYLLSKTNWWRIVKGEAQREQDIVVENDDLEQILQVVYQKGIQSILVEGGAFTHQKIIDAELWNECYLYQSDFKVGEGIAAPDLKKAVLREQFFIESDCIRVFVPES